MNDLVGVIARSLGESRVTLVDVGASGGIHYRWKRWSRLLRVIGFEPEEREFVKLPQTPSERWFNVALAGARGHRILNVTREQSNCSLLRPNRPVLDRLQWSRSDPAMDFEITKEVHVDCMSLDEVLSSEKISPDFLKLDTQGSELEILRGAQRALSEDLLLAEVEVEFIPIYENQPLFADVDAFMRHSGFTLLDLGNVLSIKPRGMAGLGGPKGRIVAADALYAKESAYPEPLHRKSRAKVCATIIGYAAYGYPELALSVLEEMGPKKLLLDGLEGIEDALWAACRRTQRFQNLPARRLLAGWAERIWRRLRPTEHCLWEGAVGNRVP